MCYLKELFGVYNHGGNVRCVTLKNSLVSSHGGNVRCVTLKISLVSTIMVAMLDVLP